MVIAVVLWLAFLVASLQDLGGYGDLWAVPVCVPLVVGLLALWRWEQARKRQGRVTFAEELTRAALTGPFSLVGVLVRGPRAPTAAPTSAPTPLPRPAPTPDARPPASDRGREVDADVASSARFELESDEGLRRFLQALASARGVELRGPAHPGRLDAAEATLGRPLPPLLRRVLAISDGLRRDLLLELGTNDAALVDRSPERAGMLDLWRFFREAADLLPEEAARADEELGHGLLPIATHEDDGGPVVSVSLVTGAVYEHHGGEAGELVASELRTWLTRLLP